MADQGRIDFGAIRAAMSDLKLSSKVTPNAPIETDQVFFPDGHRGVLDLGRQLVVGNRGMGKSFWTHALVNQDLREVLARKYKLSELARTEVVIGFNGSDRLSAVAPTTDEIAIALRHGCDPDVIWRAVLLRATHSLGGTGPNPNFREAMEQITATPDLYANVLSAADNKLTREGRSLLVVFDALDRLAEDWEGIGKLTKGLLVRSLGLQSFRAIHAKIFIRNDQMGDTSLFNFRDSSKIRNDRVNLSWRASDLYGLLLFELLRSQKAKHALDTLASQTRTRAALPEYGQIDTAALEEQAILISAIAGEFMGSHKKRGRVYSWVPLHLSDADNNCSPRTFLTAWKSAADYVPSPTDRVVDHLGLIDGVRRASNTRLSELREDYPWIDAALNPLRRQLVPMLRNELFSLWENDGVIDRIIAELDKNGWLAPIDVFLDREPMALLSTMVSIAVMEERASGKINVPDIFRVEAEILRKGGVAVPRRA